MPLALSLNSDCLKFQLFPLPNPPRDRHHSSQTHTSQFSTAAHSLWDSAVHSSRYFCSCHTGHGKTHQKTKNKQKIQNKQKKKIKKYGEEFPVGKQCMSAGLEQTPPKLSLCSAVQEQREAARRSREGAPELNCSLTEHPMTATALPSTGGLRGT